MRLQRSSFARSLAFIVLMATTATTSARVGETWEQIETRYGQAKGSQGADELGNATRVYHFHDFTVLVTFVNGVSTAEKFIKFKDHVPSDRWEPMTAQEVAAILSAYESAGVKWGEPGPDAKRPMWWTSVDGQLKAINMANQLVVATVSYLDQRQAKRADLEAEKKAKEAEKLKGF